MGMDYYGETYGSDSKEYRNHATQQDKWLAPLIQEWMEREYTIIVTGDHGINKDGSHGGTTPDQRDVPLFVIRPNVKGRGDTGETVSHLQIAPTVLQLLNVPIPETMKHQSLLLD
jgi:arylsulfatase A-like enzyme